MLRATLEDAIFTVESFRSEESYRLWLATSLFPSFAGAVRQSTRLDHTMRGTLVLEEYVLSYSKASIVQELEVYRYLGQCSPLPTLYDSDR